MFQTPSGYPAWQNNWLWAAWGAKLPSHMEIASREDPDPGGLGFVGPRMLRPQGPWEFQAPRSQEATPSGTHSNRAGLATADHLEGQCQLLSQGQVHIFPGPLHLACACKQFSRNPSPSILGQIKSLNSLPPQSLLWNLYSFTTP